jgi:hypothetical protein
MNDLRTILLVVWAVGLFPAAGVFATRSGHEEAIEIGIVRTVLWPLVLLRHLPRLVWQALK